MNIIDAIKSGRRFRRQGDTRYYTSLQYYIEDCDIQNEYILDTKWEIEEEDMVTIPISKLEKALLAAYDLGQDSHPQTLCGIRDKLIEFMQEN